MLYNLLADANPYRQATIGEAALYALLGFLIVFIGIAFLIFIVWAIGKLMTVFNKKTAQAKEKTVAKKAEIAEMPNTGNEEELSDEVVAVITAAIAAYYQKENKKCEFTVKRIKRVL